VKASIKNQKRGGLKMLGKKSSGNLSYYLNGTFEKGLYYIYFGFIISFSGIVGLLSGFVRNMAVISSFVFFILGVLLIVHAYDEVKEKGDVHNV